MDLRSAIEASVALHDKTASLREADPRLQDYREKCAAVDFHAFAVIKTAAPADIAREVVQLGKKPLAWGLGLGLPALGVGHAMVTDARRQGGELARDVRNQALLTAAGVGGMQALGNLLTAAPPAQLNMQPSTDSGWTPGNMPMKLAARIMVDDLLEDACSVGTSLEKRAALVHLIVHRSDSMAQVRSLLR